MKHTVAQGHIQGAQTIRADLLKAIGLAEADLPRTKRAEQLVDEIRAHLWEVEHHLKHLYEIAGE